MLHTVRSMFSCCRDPVPVPVNAEVPAAGVSQAAVTPRPERDGEQAAAPVRSGWWHRLTKRNARDRSGQNSTSSPAGSQVELLTQDGAAAGALSARGTGVAGANAAGAAAAAADGQEDDADRLSKVVLAYNSFTDVSTESDRSRSVRN